MSNSVKLSYEKISICDVYKEVITNLRILIRASSSRAQFLYVNSGDDKRSVFPSSY